MATAAVSTTLVNGTANSAVPVNGNFTDLVTFLNGSVVHRDGTKAFTGVVDHGSNKITGVGAGTLSTDAVNKGQLDLKADLASPTFTGTVTVPTGVAGTSAVNKTQMDAAIDFATPSGDVLAGSTVAATNASQEITVSYGRTFTANPIVTVTNGDRTAANFTASINGKTTTSCTIRCEGAGVGVSVRVDWVAVGTLT
jgi:hypothetical protein